MGMALSSRSLVHDRRRDPGLLRPDRREEPESPQGEVTEEDRCRFHLRRLRVPSF